MAAASLAAVGVASYYWRSRTGIPDKHTTAPNTGELKCPVEGVSLRVIRHMCCRQGRRARPVGRPSDHWDGNDAVRQAGEQITSPKHANSHDIFVIEIGYTGAGLWCHPFC